MTWPDQVNQVVCADVLDYLSEIPDTVVQTCITSPPFWGLRDYGVEGQLGFERTPEEFVLKLVAVFQEVRRVLRDDGTIWLNLGSSYASDDINPSQSPLLRRAPACDNDDIESPDFQADDRVCPDCDDVFQAAIRSRHVDTVHSDQRGGRGEPQPLPKAHDIERRDSVRALPDFSPTSSLGSIRSSFSGGSQESVANQNHEEISPLNADSYVDDVRPSGDSSACTPDTSRKLPPLVVRTVGKESFYSACQSPDCQGIGRCGLCWCNLAIPSLNVKRKDMINIPNLVAFALQADGWYLRSDIIWAKPNPMPESVTDRPTKSHEYLFLLSKSERYYYDADAIREPLNKPSDESAGFYKDWATVKDGRTKAAHRRTPPSRAPGYIGPAGGRNKRTVWTVAPEPCPHAHFATFPTKLVEPCILAGTSEKGQCRECGKPWVRITEKVPTGKTQKMADGWATHEGGHGSIHRDGRESGESGKSVTELKTLGWRPDCECGGDPVPQIVLDPFCGKGTTAKRAKELGREYVTCDLNEEYCELARQELSQRELF